MRSWTNQVKPRCNGRKEPRKWLSSKIRLLLTTGSLTSSISFPSDFSQIPQLSQKLRWCRSIAVQRLQPCQALHSRVKPVPGINSNLPSQCCWYYQKLIITNIFRRSQTAAVPALEAGRGTSVYSAWTIPPYDLACQPLP